MNATGASHSHADVGPTSKGIGPHGLRYRRLVLSLVLGAIAVTAAVGLYSVLVPGEFGKTQAKVLGTSVAISGTSIVILSFVPTWERRLLGPLPFVGAAITIIVVWLALLGMWGEVGQVSFWKLTGTLAILAAWSWLVCMLALATLPPRYLWVFLAAAGLTLALALIGIGAILSEDISEGVARTAAALAVLSTAFVLTVPVLHRASRGEIVEDSPCACFCPRCGAPAAVASDESATCTRCGSCFLVSYLPPSESDNAAGGAGPEVRPV